MHDIRIKRWEDGSLEATKRDESRSLLQTVSVNARGRIHAITIRGKEWAESELYVDLIGRHSSATFKTTYLNEKQGVLTQWAARSTLGHISGLLTIQPEKGTTWRSTFVRSGITTTGASGSGNKWQMSVRDAQGNAIRRTESMGQESSGDRYVRCARPPGGTRHNDHRLSIWPQG